RWAEGYFNDNEIVLYQKSRRDSVFFVGALQIDPFGNSNLIGLRSPSGRGFRLRGPGAIATTTNASHVRRFYLFTSEHTPRVFVERCDFVSTVGGGKGRGRWARRAGIAGRRPALLRDAARNPRLSRGDEAAAPSLRPSGRHRRAGADEHGVSAHRARSRPGDRVAERGGARHPAPARGSARTP